MERKLRQGTKYAQLIEELNDLIRERAYRADTCLPSERELCERYDVSRITVRRALAEMESAGVIYRIQGKGAFVRSERVSAQLPALKSLTEEMQDSHISCGSRILALETVPASKKVARMLEIPENTPVVMLKRLRLVDGKPLAIETCYLSPDVGPTVKEHIADNISLYGILREKCRVSPVRAEQSLEIGFLQSWEQAQLGENAPVYAIFTTRQAFDENNRPLEYVEGKYRGDRYTYHISMTADHSHGWSQS